MIARTLARCTPTVDGKWESRIGNLGIAIQAHARERGTGGMVVYIFL